MRAASEPLITLLLSKQFERCDLYSFTLATGSVVRLAALDVDVIHAGNRYYSNPSIERKDTRPTAHWKAGVDTDGWHVHIIPRQANAITGAEFPDTLNGQPWLAALKAGALDGATASVDRAYFAAWPEPWTPTVTPVGTINLFAGLVAEIDFTAMSAIITINSHMELLSQEMPRNLFQSGCRFTLFGPGCALTAASFATNGSVGADSTSSAINASIGQPAGYFDLGRLVMTSGANQTFSRGVRSWDGSTLKLRSPFPFPVSTGNTFTVYPGCDKTLTMCNAKFGNEANFGGMPYIPAPENAV